MNVSARSVGDTPELSAPSVASTGNWEELHAPAVQSRRAPMAQGVLCRAQQGPAHARLSWPREGMLRLCIRDAPGNTGKMTVPHMNCLKCELQVCGTGPAPETASNTNTTYHCPS